MHGKIGGEGAFIFQPDFTAVSLSESVVVVMAHQLNLSPARMGKLNWCYFTEYHHL